MGKSNTPACARAQVRYNRRVAPGELCSASLCSLSLSQSNIFLLVQMHSGLANTLKTESLKQHHLDTQLTHSLLIFFIHHILLYCLLLCRYTGGRAAFALLRGTSVCLGATSHN